jgi:hypothetical protein
VGESGSLSAVTLDPGAVARPMSAVDHGSGFFSREWVVRGHIGTIAAISASAVRVISRRHFAETGHSSLFQEMK